jgi:transposase
MVYNDWGLYGFVQMLTDKCLRAGKELHTISERDTTKQYHRCGLVMGRDDNSAINMYQRFLAWLRPCADDSVQCADVFTAVEDVDTTSEHI